MTELRTTMQELDYHPETGAVLDRETMLRIADLEKEIQTFRGLNHLRATARNVGLPEAKLAGAAGSQLWQIVYFALRLFDHAYPNAGKTPHERFGPVKSRSDILDAAIALEDALEELQPENMATANVVTAAKTLLEVLD